MSAVLWTSNDAAKATGGQNTHPWQATGLSIDTRNITPGDLFIALTDVRDGHDFVAQALDKGASAALVSRIPAGVDANAPLLVVPDVLAALGDMAAAARARSPAKVVAVTGSVGKTSTKDMMRVVLGNPGHVHTAEKSFNNHWGVPLTLARMPQDTSVALIEIGMNHPGEIAPLAKLARPDIAVVTTVVAAHLEAFSDVDEIAREKAAIFTGLKPGGVAIINGDIAQTDILHKAALAANATIVTFGESPGCDYWLETVTVANDVTVARARIQGVPYLFKIMTAGRHFAVNALSTLAVASALGDDAAVAACNLVNWVPPPGRGTRETIVLDVVEDDLTIDLLDDAFNANPASMAAALDVLVATVPRDGLGRVARGRRIAVLGDMLELGPSEADLHRAVSELPALADIDLVHCVGPRMQSLFEVLPPNKRGIWVAGATDMSARVHSLIDAGDVVLVKGSKGSKVSLVVDAIRNLGHPQTNKIRGTE